MYDNDDDDDIDKIGLLKHSGILYRLVSGIYFLICLYLEPKRYKKSSKLCPG